MNTEEHHDVKIVVTYNNGYKTWEAVAFETSEAGLTICQGEVNTVLAYPRKSFNYHTGEYSEEVDERHIAIPFHSIYAMRWEKI